MGVLQGILRFDLPVAVPADHARMTINKSGIVMRRMVERVARIHGFRNRAAPAGSVGWGQLHGESVYSTVVTILPTIATVLNALEPWGFLRFYGGLKWRRGSESNPYAALKTRKLLISYGSKKTKKTPWTRG